MDSGVNRSQVAYIVEIFLLKTITMNKIMIYKAMKLFDLFNSKLAPCWENQESDKES